MTKVNPNNGIETKSDILPRDIFKQYQNISIAFRSEDFHQKGKI